MWKCCYTGTLKRAVGTLDIHHPPPSKPQVCVSPCTQTVIWMLSASHTSPLLSVT